MKNRETAKSFLGEGFDFPTINEVTKQDNIRKILKFCILTVQAYRGRNYCIVYGWVCIDYSVITIIKRNICTGEELTWHKTNHYPSEMNFVQDPKVGDSIISQELSSTCSGQGRGLWSVGNPGV